MTSPAAGSIPAADDQGGTGGVTNETRHLGSETTAAPFAVQPEDHQVRIPCMTENRCTGVVITLDDDLTVTHGNIVIVYLQPTTSLPHHLFS